MTISDISLALTYAKAQLDKWENTPATVKLSYDVISSNIVAWASNVTKLESALNTAVSALIAGL